MKLILVYRIYEIYHGLLEIPDWAQYKWFDSPEDALAYLKEHHRHSGYIILPTTQLVDD
jgi:hypothetical protein